MRVYLDNWQKELILRYVGVEVTGPPVEECKKVRVHARGLFPEELFRNRFPTEPTETYEYRKLTYKPITQSAYNKIANTLAKIAAEPDFSVIWSKEGQALQQYCEEDYPVYDSVVTWLFDVGLHAQLVEPNGVIAVVPLEWEWEEGELPRPHAKVYKPEDVLYHREGVVSILREPDGTFLLLDKEKIGKIEVLPGKKIASQVLFVHNFGTPPTFLIGGDDTDYQGEYYQSFLSGCIPHWDAAVLDNSVLRAAVHGHVYPEYQTIEVSDCTTCHGKGKYHVVAPDGSPQYVSCHSCNGSGKAHSPGFGNISIRLDDLPRDISPSGGVPPVKQYINKDFSSIPILEQSIAKSLYYAYSAVNMEFLAEVPAAQSGIAKAYDRMYLNSFIHKVARFLLGRMLRWVYYYIALYREAWPYSPESPKLPATVLPVITIPDTFDVLPQDTILNELQMAKSSGAPLPVVDSINDALIASTLSGKQDDIKEFEIIKNLDPLYGYTIADKLGIRAAGGVTQEDFVLSMHITQWVKYASKHVSKDGKPFLEWLEEDQKDYLTAKAQEYARQSVTNIG